VNKPVRLWWLRRDLRLADQPSLLAAASGAGVLPLFVVDPELWGPSGDVRRAYLIGSLRALDAELSGALHVRWGDPAVVVPQVAKQAGADEVHVASDFGPYGARRDQSVDAVLRDDGRSLVRSGSPYAVAPGRVRKGDGTPYRVFTPFYRAWLAHGWRAPAPGPQPDVNWIDAGGGEPWPQTPDLGSLTLPEMGEQAAQRQWADFRLNRLDEYGETRNRPDLPGTSGLSAALKWGEIHPRTLLADLGDSPSHETFRRELAWREFYADVLHHAPWSARANLRPELRTIENDEGDDSDSSFQAWSAGRTGFPFVDAGMRQLRTEGWIHNRVRMVVASFLVKDLHLSWTRGAHWFMTMLRDGDLASNQHGWQWVAGTGTDASPYYRVFNPIGQGLRFDPEGDYVRRYVHELREVPGPSVHQPWLLPEGPPPAYPERVIDHAEERRVALDRYAAAKRP
jgi:deoxyribodipyrimidine photo-lyase